MVLPHVCRGTDQVILEIVPKQSDDVALEKIEVQGQMTTIPGMRRVKTVHTKMMLRSTETGVIAGLFREEGNDVETRVPGLHRLLVVGKAFKHKSVNKIKYNTMILVTPTIIPDKHDEEFNQDIENYKNSLATSLK